MGGGGEGVANTIHIATFTPDMSLGFSSLKVRTNWKKKKNPTKTKSALRNLKLAQKQIQTKKSDHGEASG